jgi:dTDP-4-amino-4,6-dideoxygalactose transaminase
VVEDNAHGLFGAYRRRPLGSFGALAALSFHETKNLSCGEGGALVINDPRLVLRAEILREKGTDRSRFFRGEIDRYTWIDVGSSFLLSDILAAILWAQIEQADCIQQRRRDIWERYHAGLGEWVKACGFSVQSVPVHCESSYHLFAILTATPAQQIELIAHFKAREINAVFHYQPLHLTPQGQRFGGSVGQCPVAESVAARIVRLPFHFNLTENEVDCVIAAAMECHPL